MLWGAPAFMDSQKIENLLNLSLNATEEEREKSESLNVGYNRDERTWEVIVKYHGDISRIADEVVKVEELLAGYAIIRLPQSLVVSLAEIEEIEYIEKPKRLFYNVTDAINSSCFLPVTVRPPYLTGQGVIVAVIDSGIDYMHEDFRNTDGSSRILYLWDQTLQAESVNAGIPAESGYAGTAAPPAGFYDGVEFDKERIDAALAAGSTQEAYRIVPSRDISGHGTAVAGIAAGNGSDSSGQYSGAAPKSEMIIVKLGNPQPDSFPRTTELMRALTYCVRKAIALTRPVAINISFGNTYGAHNGNSLLERFIDNVSEVGRTVICVGSGNEGASLGHASGVAFQTTQVELSIAEYERNVSVQLWKNYVDRYHITLTAPSGREEEIDTLSIGTRRIVMENTEILMYIGDALPYSVNQELYFDFLPLGEMTYVNAGIWTFRLAPISVVTGNYSFYLPSAAVRSTRTAFYRPSPDVTLTIPSTAGRVVTVGAYNSNYNAYADFSGRGYIYSQGYIQSSAGNSAAGNVSGNTFDGASGGNAVRMQRTNVGNIGNREGIWLTKPDLVAPGVGIMTARTGGGYEARTGTSFATPFVTGASALLMEWGIVKGNDPYLYGEKVKAYLQRGAKQLPGFTEYPNAQVGYGALCVKNSLPG